MIILRKIASTQSSSSIVADTLSGTTNGSNQVFSTTYDYQPDRITIYYNGQALHAGDDFLQTGDNQITLKYIAPFPGEPLRATYELL